MKIYVASSWRNTEQPAVVQALQNFGHEVYDFKNPQPGDNGFHWSEIDRDWKYWTGPTFLRALEHPIAQAGFKSDMDALRSCDACVLVLPCGRSAHLELGWAVGAGKRSAILLADPNRPEAGHSMDVGRPCSACGDIDGCHVPAQRLRELEPELMYRMVDRICCTLPELLDWCRATAPAVVAG